MRAYILPSRHSAGIGVIALLWIAVSAAAAMPPVNDDFANRIILQQPPPGGSIILEGTLNGATIEPNEFVYRPYFNPPLTKSVWWEVVMTNWFQPLVIEVMERTEWNSANFLLVDIGTNSNPTAFPISGLINPFDDPNSALPIHPILVRPQITSPHVQPGFTATNDGMRHYLSVVGIDDRSVFKLKVTVTNVVPFAAEPVSHIIATNESVQFTGYSWGAQTSLGGGYQWLHDGVAIPGETSAILTLRGVTANQAGDYSLVTTNINIDPTTFNPNWVLIKMTSAVAHLTVTATNSAPRFVAPTILSTSNFAFALNGETGRSYRIESSMGLTNWNPEVSFLAGYDNFTPRPGSVIFNSNGAGVFSLPLTAMNKFLRASIYRPANDICNDNLKAIRFGKDAWAMTNRKELLNPFDTVDLAFPYFLAYYFKGQFPVCPDGGVYTPGKIGELPTCSIPGHVLEEPR